jgi:hypothetical protein
MTWFENEWMPTYTINLRDPTDHDSSWRRPKIEDEQMIIKFNNTQREKNKDFIVKEKMKDALSVQFLLN